MWMQDGCNVYMVVMFHGHFDYFQKKRKIEKKTSFGCRSNTKPGDHGTLNAHNRWFILFDHVRGSAWIEIHWNRIWLRARSHTTSHYTRGSVTTRHDFERVLGRPLHTFFWALTISWSRHWLMCEVALRAHGSPCPFHANLWASGDAHLLHPPLFSLGRFHDPNCDCAWAHHAHLWQGKRRLVGGPKVEKTRVASWHVQIQPHQFPSMCLSLVPLEFDGRATYMEIHH